MKRLWYVILLVIPAILYALLTGPSSYRYTVIIDPGHGGLSLNPISVHGDKYDPVEQRYLVPYQQGASVGRIFEGDIAYDIGLMTSEYLALTKTSSGREEFFKILKKYDPAAQKPTEPIRVLLSRENGYPGNLISKYDGKIDEDVNSEFRLFDYPDIKNRSRQAGIISRINAKKPDLVVSLHVDSLGPPKGAMAAVVTPGFETYYKAIDYIKGDSSQRKQVYRDFTSGPYANWIQMSSERSAFEWFLCDSWIYFTGYWSRKNGMEADVNKFRGIRQDYVQWSYQGDSWKLAKNNFNRQGILNLASMDFSDKFWQREQSRAESWRREGGKEGVGGDNLYASNELLRFIRKGLLVNGSLSAKKIPEIREPHWSTWSLPTYINAVNAFLELGFLNNKYDRERLVKFKKIHAEALAVGIYSLLYGIQNTETKVNDMPVGQSLDLMKYRDYQGSNYFQDVVP